MTFALTVDASKFRTHLANVVAQYQDAGAKVIPVIKGNGYGFGRISLADEVTKLNLDQICVGTIWEAAEVLENFSGEVVVLEPISSADSLSIGQWATLLEEHSDRLIAVISATELQVLQTIGVKKIWVEALTSMNRFGLAPHQIAEALKTLDSQISVVGFSLHLPIVQPAISKLTKFETSGVNSNSNKVRETVGWISWLSEISELSTGQITINVSHLSPSEIAQIKRERPDVALQIRIGTSLWLGNPKALSVTGTVLAVHEVGTNEKAGYQQNSGGRKVVVVSGGTAHGVALAAPITTSSLRKRGIAVVEGIAQAVGKIRSPFTYKGNNLEFVEPPHMQVSMLWSDGKDIKVGDEIFCTVRNTTAHFDAVIWQ
jgi:hypothetical protein